MIKVLLYSAAAMALNSAVAMADGYPNLIGTWTTAGYPGGAYFGDGDHDPDEKLPVFIDETMLWTLVIEKQERAGLIGTWSTKVKTEKLVGVIRRDKVNLLLADEDNEYEVFLISENEMELCAHDSGERTLAGCLIMKRQ